MLTPGLTNAPITKLLLIYTVAASVALSILDLKHLSAIHVSPHLHPYGQYWRILLWQVAGFANSTEALFAAMIVYHCRVVERAWGKRKMATFLLSTLPYTTLLPPILLALLVRPLSLNTVGYLPSGPTASLFAVLAQYHASIPHTVRYCISTSASSSETSNENSSSSIGKSLTLLLSDKSTTYLVAAQLALSQFPGMMLPAVVGWGVGVAWRMELLPGLSAGMGTERASMMIYVGDWKVKQLLLRLVVWVVLVLDRDRDLDRRSDSVYGWEGTD
ncbi:hypothetical protein EYZ11_011118 [Aspergillus tanneri]|uniref:Peptidase S54 rhomboid domain-containing protein n=1 Tax=Aspergillus tanneri TaxID=1220188 RepID=A0A4S3J486_9EURO|nr:hypothetical protein EYZ11_011118 [Aspergillus tanneri]